MRLFIIQTRKNRLTQLRRGLTLVELLAVVAVLAILLSVAIPVIRPALKERKLRESSRLINAYFAGVQARAAELGRPVGVVLVRGHGNRAQDKFQCTEIFTAEVPQPYAGDLVDSRAFVTKTDGNWVINFANSSLLRNLVTPPFTDPVTKKKTPGDLFTLRLDHKDPVYLCQSTGNAQAVFVKKVGDLSGPPWQYQKRIRGVPFQVYRTPTRSLASPLQLPSGTAIDLSVSGLGFQGSQFNPNSKFGPGNIAIMFSPNGSVDSVSVGGQPIAQSSKIYLLIGRVNQIIPDNLFKRPTSSDPDGANLPDPANYWFTINPRTGHIRNSANRADLISYPPQSTGRGIQQTRQDAIDGIGVGGR